MASPGASAAAMTLRDAAVRELEREVAAHRSVAPEHELGDQHGHGSMGRSSPVARACSSAIS